MLKFGPNLGVLISADIGEEHYESLKRFLRVIDGMLQPFVLSSGATTPPSPSVDGEMHIVGEGANGDWSGRDGNIARRLDDGVESPGWEFFAPKHGWEVRNVGQLDGSGKPVKLVYCEDDVWRVDSGSGGGENTVVDVSADSYELAAGHANAYIRLTSVNPKTVLIRQESEHPLPENGEWNLRCVGPEDATIVIGSGSISLPAGGSLVIPPGGTVTLKRIATDTFDLIGQTTGTGGSGDGGVQSVNGDSGPDVVITAAGLGAATVGDLAAKENIANKAQNLDSPSASTYPSTQAVANAIAGVMSGLSPQGEWNSLTNTPTLTSSVGTEGHYYQVSVASDGVTTLNGISTWGLGDRVIFNGSAWIREKNYQLVSEVNGQTGSVDLGPADVGAAPASHVGAGGSAHALATESQSGFMSQTDKVKLNGAAPLDAPSFTGNASFSGSVTFAGLGRRILANFSDSVHSNRLLFQTTVTNGATRVDVIPNGTGTTTTIGAFNNSDPTNAGWARLVATATNTRIESTVSGTAAYLPLAFYTGGTMRATIEVSGMLNALYDFQVKAAAGQASIWLTQGETNNGRIYAGGGAGTDVIVEANRFAGMTGASKSYMSVAGVEKISAVATSVTISVATVINGSLTATSFTGSGSGLTALNANSLASGTVPDARLPATQSGKTFTSNTTVGDGTGRKAIYVNGGNSGAGGGAAIMLQTAGGDASAAFGNRSAIYGTAYDSSLAIHTATAYIKFFTNGGSTVPLTIAGNRLLVNTETDDGSNAVQVAGDVKAWGFTGSGAGLTNLNASMLATGEINTNLIRAATTGQYGITQLVDSIASTSTSMAATANSVRFAYETLNASKQNDLGFTPVQQGTGVGQSPNNVKIGWKSGNKLGLTVDSSDIGNFAMESWASANFASKATPSQTYQSVTAAATTTINAASGTHILLSLGTNITTLNLPSPAAGEAFALTFEITTSGTRSIAWPAGSKFEDGVAPEITPNGVSRVIATKAGSNPWLISSAGKGFA